MWVDQGRARTALGGSDGAMQGRAMIGRKVRAAVAAPRSSAAVAGRAFAENRINHALELFGACMLIVAFLAMAMFV